jgi:hypothetical protein
VREEKVRSLIPLPIENVELERTIFRDRRVKKIVALAPGESEPLHKYRPP